MTGLSTIVWPSSRTSAGIRPRGLARCNGSSGSSQLAATSSSVTPASIATEAAPFRRGSRDDLPYGLPGRGADC